MNTAPKETVSSLPDGPKPTPAPAQTGNGGSSEGKTSGGEAAGGKVQTTATGNKEPSKEGVVKLSFIGDVMFASKVEDLLKKNGWDYPYLHVKDELARADITVANLETPITTQGTAQSKEYVYRSSPQALPALQAAGIDLVNTANNHIMDYGQAGLLDTMDHLDQVGLKRVGIGHDLDEAYKPVIMEHAGMKIAFLGFSRVVPETSWFAGKNKPGVAGTYTTELPLEAIAAAREQADLVVVISHWGVERQDNPTKDQTDLAHKYIDQGADLVVASHPHVLQGFEQYKGKWIAYSLGNFIFTTNEEPVTWESMILNAECTKDRNCDLSMVPILTKWAQPVKMTEEDGSKLFDRMGRISINARVDKEGKVYQADPPPLPIKKPVISKPSSTATSGGNTKANPPSTGGVPPQSPGSTPATTPKSGGASPTQQSTKAPTETQQKKQPQPSP